MRLIQALRLHKNSSVALVGAGGKTTALFSLARDYKSAINLPFHSKSLRIFVSATTHLATPQLAKADSYYIVTNVHQLDSIESNLPEGVLLFFGPPVEDERFAGLNPNFMEQIARLATRLDAPFLIESDGSRRKPFKAPAPHEPVIPTWIENVIVVVGLSALGKPLNSEWVHRPELVATIANQDMGSLITLDTLSRVLKHPCGGMKGIPTNARRIALLNQADTPERQAAGAYLAEPLLEVYHSVLVASLEPGVHADNTPAVLKEGIYAVHERVAGIILAAGASTRMGVLKQTLRWKGEAMVRHVARTALSAGLDPVIIVTGCAADQVENELDGLSVTVVNNPDWLEGQSSSVKAGVKLLPDYIGAAVFLLADQPLIPVRLIRNLIEQHATDLSPIVAPQVEGQRANPVLFDRITFNDLLKLSGDTGGRALFSRFPVNRVQWHDPAVTLDIDTPEDYQRLLDMPNT